MFGRTPLLWLVGCALACTTLTEAADTGGPDVAGKDDGSGPVPGSASGSCIEPDPPPCAESSTGSSKAQCEASANGWLACQRIHIDDDKDYCYCFVKLGTNDLTKIAEGLDQCDAFAYVANEAMTDYAEGLLAWCELRWK
jgi:hypothetical protein